MLIRPAAAMTLIWLITSAACARPAPPSSAPASPPATAAPAATSEQRLTAKKGDVVITISSQPGRIVDTTAPPPPPGHPAPANPYLSAACAGDAVGCSEAGALLRAARSVQDFVEALRRNGFVVTSG